MVEHDKLLTDILYLIQSLRYVDLSQPALPKCSLKSTKNQGYRSLNIKNFMLECLQEKKLMVAKWSVVLTFKYKNSLATFKTIRKSIIQKHQTKC